MPTGGPRPYFNHRIDLLEALFEKSQLDAAILGALERELKQRSTDRAVKLRLRVAEAMKTISARQPTSAMAGHSASPTMPTISSNANQSGGAARARSSGIAAVSRRNGPLSEKIELGELPSARPPKSTNEPQAILAAWTALEALSPQTYRRPEDMAGGERRRIAELKMSPLPWVRGERSKPNYQLYYQIILGAIPMDKATEELVKAFGQDEELGARPREKAAIAAILVDRKGILVEENGIAVSSFAWALPLALKLKLSSLGAWPSIEHKIVEKLDEMVRRQDDDGAPIPLDLATIDRTYRWLVEQFGLSDSLVEPPSFALRVYHHIRAKNAPEASILNSFFLGDLSRTGSLINSGSAPDGVRRYLGMERPNDAPDLLTNRQALERAVAPAMMPAARWPSPGGHPLVLLQQAAVNLARAELAKGEGMIAVNGPPGTGKTTLLRDIVAANVLDRALAMSAFDDPEAAFSPSGEKVKAGDSGFFHLYTLAPSLKGYEMLVASSNNKAVENVSSELPAAKAVGRRVEELSYFRSISDVVHGPRMFDADDDDDRADPVETWGLIAAVLGNAGNRFNFQQSFWWHKEYGFRLYLKAVKGDPVVREVKHPETGEVIERRTPAVILSEKPPTPQVVKIRWRSARDTLLRLKREIDVELKALEAVRQLCLKLTVMRDELFGKESALKQSFSRLAAAQADKFKLETHLADMQATRDQSERNVFDHLTLRPGFFSRLFHTRRWKDWSDAHAPLMQAALQARGAFSAAKQALEKANATFSALTADIRRLEGAVASLRQNVDEASRSVEQHRAELGDRVVDATFFAKGHEASNLAAPWLPDSLHRKREELFIAAVAVHRAFIDAAAQKVLHNLSILMDIFSGGPPQDDTKRKLLGELWSTLFMVVPVLSTTFASVERMLGDMPAGSIGWLLIDEAGQAPPQAAIGAVMRARRTVVVGDPLQIPPVVTLPERLNAEICRFFKIDKPLWAAPEASVQTLADRASAFQGVFRSDQEPRKVGIPLLVHRRCQEPMFGISNRIAYDGQMVHAPSARNPGTVGAAIGPSAWFDIDGEADSKWCPAEGEFVVRLLKQIAEAGAADPDLFIITPFRIVAQELRRRLERETALFAALKIDIRKWAEDRIGTVHTVQGREAESVMLVLGAPKASQNGARAWAAGSPNIFNVAVSRAKQNLYVIGSYGAWSGVGCARELAEMDRRRV